MKASIVVLALTLAVACSSKKKAEEQPAPAAHDAAPTAIQVDSTTPVARLIELVTGFDSKRLDALQAASKACRLLAGKTEPGARAAVMAAASSALDKLDPGHAVRTSCARALGSFTGDDVIDALVRIAGDENDQLAVRIGAIDGLRQLAAPRTAEPIARLMMSDNKLADSARLALVAIGDEAVPLMLRALEGGWPEGVAPGTAALAAARVLGDLRRADAVPALLASLARDPQPAMVSRKGEAGMTHHVAVIEALRKIGGAKAAAALLAYARKSKDPTLATPAYDAYGFIAADGAEAGKLVGVLTDGKAAPNVRIAAGLAAARVTRDAAIGKRIDKACADFAAAGDSAKRLFLVCAGLVARARVGIECAAEAACFAKVMREPDASLAERMAAAVPNADALSDGARAELAHAARERALVGLARLGDKARGEQQAILGAIASTHRLVHQAAVDALTRVAERPCAPCVKVLDEASAALSKDNRPVAAQMLIDTEAARLVLAR